MADAQATTTTETPATATAEAAGADLFADAGAATADTGATAAPGDAAATDAAKDGAEAAGDDLFNGKVEPEKAAEGDAVPESYDFKMPEGVELDAALSNEFTPIAKELKLNNDQAQKLVDLYANKIMPQFAARQAQALRQIQTKWAADAKADPEFGGSEAKLKESIASVARAKSFLGADFAKEIGVLGIGNNPTLLKSLAKLGRALAEDSPAGGGISIGKQSPKEILYPNQK